MIEDILQILKYDAELTALLRPTAADKKIYMYRGKSETCIAYKYSVISSDGVKTQTKLEINCISPDYFTAEKMLDRVKGLLLTVGDRQLNDRILNVSLNGGGVLFDEATEQHIIKAYFILTSKERMN